MFKIVGSRRLAELLERLETQNQTIDDFLLKINRSHQMLDELTDALDKERQEYAALEDEKFELERQNKEMRELIEKLNGGSENKVTLKISEDLEVITPIVSYGPSAFERLFQSNRLSDAQDSPQAIQLGLLMIAEEALAQLVGEFAQEIGDVD